MQPSTITITIRPLANELEDVVDEDCDFRPLSPDHQHVGLGG